MSIFEPQLKMLWLEQFLVLCQESDFVLASQKLDISTQMLKHNINQLEKTLETHLIERQGKYFSLTHEGRLFFAESQRVLTKIRQMSKRVKQEFLGSLYGDLTLAWSSGFHFRQLSEILHSFAQEHANIFLRTERQTSAAFSEQRISRGEIDLAIFDYPPQNKELLVYTGKGTPYVIVSTPQKQQHWSAFSYIDTHYDLPINASSPWNEQAYPRKISSQTNSLSMLLKGLHVGVATYTPLSMAKPYLDEGILSIVAEPPELVFARTYVWVSPFSKNNSAAQLLIEKFRSKL